MNYIVVITERAILVINLDDKTEFKTEPYLYECLNTSVRVCLSRLRLSAHKLNIETMRYVSPRIPPSERICKNCNLRDFPGTLL